MYIRNEKIELLKRYSGADSMHGGTVSRRTANKTLTKLYWPSRKCSPKRLIVLVEPKKWRGTTQKIPALCAGRVGYPPHFEICSGTTEKIHGNEKQNEWKNSIVAVW